MKINLQKMELEIMQLQNNLKEAENILVGFLECIYPIYLQNLMKKITDVGGMSIQTLLSDAVQ